MNSPIREAAGVAMDSAAARQCVETYAPLARRIATAIARRLPRHVSRDDLHAAAMFGLWDAIRRHDDPSREDFVFYASTRIRGAIFDELRRTDWVSRRTRERNDRAEAAGTTVVRVDALDSMPANDIERALASGDPGRDRAEEQNSLAEIVRLLPRLSDRERLAVVGVYFQDRRLKDVALELGVTESRVSQLCTAGVSRLRENVAA